MDSFDSNIDAIGYDVQTVDEIPEQFKCPFCERLLRNVIQTCRGERACRLCYRNAQGSAFGFCPIDNEGDTVIFKDKYADKEIQRIKCYCINSNNGCSWISELAMLTNHIPECKYQLITCKKCKEQFLLLKQEVHNKEICIYREICCTFCEEQIVVSEYQSHLLICPMQPQDCTYHCGEKIKPGKMHEHVKNCLKLLSGEACIYSVLGCTYKGETGIKQHMEEAFHDHNYKLISNIDEFAHMKATLQKEQIVLKQQIEDVSNRDRSNNQLIIDMSRDIHCLEEKLSSALKSKEMAEFRLTSVEDNYMKMTRQMEKLEKQLQDVLGKIDQSRGAESNAIDHAKIIERAEKIEHIERNYTILSTNVSDLDLRQQLSENTCYDGLLLWKIDNLAHRMNQAFTGKVTALHSAPCFVKRFGYKFCARLYLNGDGMGKGSHISLFFVLMKSEYDNLLEWPFRDRVTFRLINHNNERESMKETFLPDRNSSSFQKPVRNMNVAAGCPMFISKDHLLSGDYITEDSLFIEVSVAGM